jgi:hypothetical protein
MNEGNNGGKSRADMARRANPDRLGAFSDAVIGDHHHHGARVEGSRAAGLRRAREPLADRAELCIAIIWINHHYLMRFVREPTKAHLVEFRASVLGLARARSPPNGPLAHG